MSRRYYRRKRSRDGKLLLAIISILAFYIATLVDLIVFVIPTLIYGIWGVWGYQKSKYRLITHKSIFQMVFDKGARGEYMIYRHLKKLDGEQSWLFNTYLPRENGRTTEIDAIMLHASGFYVFESKNYRGWIFGTETRRVWTQCLKPSEKAMTRKYHFLNPIMQNKLHLTYLFKAIPELADVPVYSVIVFGNRCKLREINLSSGKHTVISRKQILKTVSQLASFSANTIHNESIQLIYDKLYPMTQVGEEVKAQHILDIQNEIQNEAESSNSVHDETIIINSTEQPCAQPVSGQQNDELSYNVSQIKHCPKCGQKLLLRTARNGSKAGQQFWGCSGFSHCHYTENK